MSLLLFWRIGATWADGQQIATSWIAGSAAADVWDGSPASGAWDVAVGKTTDWTGAAPGADMWRATDSLQQAKV